jgi:hypothetical protein
MDWVERVLHVSPDGGNGSLELAIVVGAIVAVVMVLACAIRQRPRLHGGQQRFRGTGPTFLDRFGG